MLAKLLILNDKYIVTIITYIFKYYLYIDIYVVVYSFLVRCNFRCNYYYFSLPYNTKVSLLQLLPFFHTFLKFDVQSYT